MALKIDAKFKGKSILANFRQSTRSLKIKIFMGLFYLESRRN